MNFLKSVVTFRGRSGRLHWLLVTLAVMAATSAPFLVYPDIMSAIEYGQDWAVPTLYWLWVAVVCVPWAPAASRRSHDMGITGWAAAALAVPFISIVAMLVWLVWPGTKGDNQYGPSSARAVAA